jgi:hypothetical protein
MWTQIIAALAVLTLGSPVISAAQSSPKTGDTYQWSAEFVSVDTTASTLTVKAKIAYQDALSELKQFKPGERVWIQWSGIHDYSDAIRQFRKAEAGKIGDDLVMPAELVSTETPNQYVTIRMKVPGNSVAAIKDVKPGEWVTVTSRHRPPSDADAVTEVRPYTNASKSDKT